MSEENQTSEQTQPVNRSINTMEQFAALMAQWHMNIQQQLSHAHAAPDDVEIEYTKEDGSIATLTPDQRIGFRVGLIVASSIFGELPFTVTPVEAPATEQADEAPATEEAAANE